MMREKSLESFFFTGAKNPLPDKKIIHIRFYYRRLNTGQPDSLSGLCTRTYNLTYRLILVLYLVGLYTYLYVVIYNSLS